MKYDSYNGVAHRTEKLSNDNYFAYDANNENIPVVFDEPAGNFICMNKKQLQSCYIQRKYNCVIDCIY